MKSRLFLTIVFLVVAACSEHDMMDDFQITPRDGSVNVSRDGAITLSFQKTADSGTVAMNFHMMPSSLMNTLMDSVNMMGMTHGTMLSLMVRHSVSGNFTWNKGYTECVFDPDSIMVPMTKYNIHMGKGMMDMAGMHHSGGMMGMPSVMAEDMIVEFMTGN